MPESSRLPRSFFARSTLQVARDLLGARLVRLQGGERLSGIIVEAEAYRGQEDLGCHARAGLTPRTRVMFGPPGHAYIYFTYGMHWMLNFVTEEPGYPAAVLIRALQPIEGLDRIAERRNGQPAKHWTDGPAKICRALDINGELNDSDLCASQAVLFVERGFSIPDLAVTTGPRVGLNNVPEPWKSIPWRFLVKGDYLSAPSTQRF
jgi:DNA-3-methyladenine glycosylase